MRESIKEWVLRHLIEAFQVDLGPPTKRLVLKGYQDMFQVKKTGFKIQESALVNGS
jgi:hypothetical protein